MKKYALLIIAGTFVSQLSFAQATTDTVTINFVKNAAMGGTTEIKAGQLAVKKAKNYSVKMFGAKMVSDHTQAGAELKKIALKKGYAAPMTAMAASPLLANTTGTEFDKNYVTMMVSDHKKTVALFENAASKAQDADVKAYATKTLPKLKQHLASIESIAANMNLTVN